MNDVRPIDADALKRHMGIEDAVKYGNETEEQQHNSYATLMNYEISDFIDDMPTSDYAPVVHGEWKYYHKQNRAVCMACSFERDLDADFGRAISCPNCGARMDGGKRDG